MVRAWADGRLDRELAAVRPDDRWWWFRLGCKLDAIEDERTARFYDLVHARYGVGAAVLTAAGAQDYWKQQGETTRLAYDLYFPWAAAGRTAATKSTDAQLLSAWEDYYGKLTDPATQAAIAATARQLRDAQSRTPRT